jgi:arabinose-5-phosphate isomerase
MHTGDRLPLVSKGVTMPEAIDELSRKRFGCVGVVDDDGCLCGVITDGDISRHLDLDLRQTLVDDVMTRNPKTARGDQLATEVLEMLNSVKITAVFVAEGRRPIGLLHMHDLLRAGVA